MVNNIRAEGTGVVSVLIALVIGLVVMFGLIYLFSNTQSDAQSNLDAFSYSTNSIAIEACNNYCSRIMGEIGLGIGSSRESAIYSYCSEQRRFYNDQTKKKEPSTCAVMSGNPTLRIDSRCTTLCT